MGRVAASFDAGKLPLPWLTWWDVLRTGSRIGVSALDEVVFRGPVREKSVQSADGAGLEELNPVLRFRRPPCCPSLSQGMESRTGDRLIAGSPSIDSYHWQSVRLSYEPFCLASDLSRASPLRSKPRYNLALAFFANSRSVSSSASRSSAGCLSNASAALTRSS